MSEEMTLARALRYKKRVVERIRNFETEIQFNNSKVVGEESEVDVALSLKNRSAWVKHLIDLKLKIQESTQPIQKLVLELAEAKAEIAFLKKVSSVHGTVHSRYGDEPTLKYAASLRKAEIDGMVMSLQDKIDVLQTYIDLHNSKTIIKIIAPDMP